MTLVEFDFEIGHYNGTMSLDILANGQQVLHKDSFDADRFSFATQVKWPCHLELCINGKTQALDTHIDADGCVVQDKYIKLLELKIDRMPVLLHNIQLRTADQILTNVYFGFNGTVTIDLAGQDSFMWHLHQKSSVSNKEVYVVNYPPNSLKPEEN
jgi:hypothetical protein